MSAIEKVVELATHEGPVVAFCSSQKAVTVLGLLPGWRGVSGANHRQLESAVLAFNEGLLNGLALTFKAGAMGFRVKGAAKVAFLGTAHPDLLAQCAARAPGAETVLL